MSYGAAAALAAFVAVHLLTPKLRFLHGTPRSVWLSIAGGVAVAYVFVHVLPELSEGQAALARAADWRFLEYHVYLVALAGLAAFYGLDRLALASRRAERRRGGEDRTSVAVFWIHVGSFSLYNALIGYLLLHREQPGTFGLAIFAAAMALHFFVTDHSLLVHHQALYLKPGRWVLCAAVIAGALVGMATTVSEPAIAALFAFLAGGVVMNVLKEELPEERRSRYWAFAAGAAGYAALLVAL